jgi:hypothetical protein
MRLEHAGAGAGKLALSLVRLGKPWPGALVLGGLGAFFFYFARSLCSLLVSQPAKLLCFSLLFALRCRGASGGALINTNTAKRQRATRDDTQKKSIKKISFIYIKKKKSSVDSLP